MPRAAGSVADVLTDLARALRPKHLRWYVFGAQALVLRGLPRATADLDVTLLAGDMPTPTLVRTLTRAGFALRFGDEDFVAATRVVPFVHRSVGLPVDLVLGGPGLEERFAQAASLIRVGRARVPVASPTHLVLMKALAGRLKDLQDAATLLRALASEVDDRELDALAEEVSRALGEDDVLRNLAAARAAANRGAPK